MKDNFLKNYELTGNKLPIFTYPAPVLINIIDNLKDLDRTGGGTIFNILDNNPSPAGTWSNTDCSYTFNTTTNPNGNSRVQFQIKLNLQVWTAQDVEIYRENIVKLIIKKNKFFAIRIIRY